MPFREMKKSPLEYQPFIPPSQRVNPENFITMEEKVFSVFALKGITRTSNVKTEM
jgi:predicted deacetylase